jgi:hypothetical protein
MDTKSIAIGLILFGLLALGGTIDGARRKIAEQPDWVAMNWKAVVRGVVGWAIFGALALIAGIVFLLV